MDFSGNKKRVGVDSENDEEELKFEERDVLPDYDKSPRSSLLSSTGTIVIQGVVSSAEKSSGTTQLRKYTSSMCSSNTQTSIRLKRNDTLKSNNLSEELSIRRMGSVHEQQNFDNSEDSMSETSIRRISDLRSSTDSSSLSNFRNKFKRSGIEFKESGVRVQRMD